MNILVRLILLIVLFLTSQTGIASKTKFAIYQYDVNHTVLSEEVYGYDTSLKSRYCCQSPFVGNTQDRSFGAFFSDFPATRSATQIARGGGRHSGQLNQFLKQTPEQLQKTIRSFDKQIARHERWIKDPTSKVKNFSELRPGHQQNLIHHWQQDIVRHQELKSIAQDVLKGL